MKKKVIAVLLVICIVTGKLVAQEKDSVTILPTITVTSSTVVNKEVNKAFKKSFPKAQNLKWYEMNKFYLARFIESDMKHQALFTQKGYLKYDISYGYEQNLPVEIRDRILGAYEDYKITHVANVKEAGRNIWVTNLESLNHLVMVRVEDEEMEEVQKFNKS